MSKTQIIISWVFLAFFWIFVIFFTIHQEANAAVVLNQDFYENASTVGVGNAGINSSWGQAGVTLPVGDIKTIVWGVTTDFMGSGEGEWVAGDCPTQNFQFNFYQAGNNNFPATSISCSVQAVDEGFIYTIWHSTGVTLTGGVYEVRSGYGYVPPPELLGSTGSLWAGNAFGNAGVGTGSGGSISGLADLFLILCDDVCEFSPAPPPPTTEFNEVLEYVYDPDLNNTFGTSSIGADFSIAQYDWLDSFGYTLSSPTGTIVASGSLPSTENGLFTLSSEYDFDTTGVYILQAYFVSDSGVTINNPVSLYITINAPTWSFDPVTGDLVPTASTTIATSSLTYLKVECPDDLLVGSLCKLAVGMFIPSTAAIQTVQASFYGLMTKAPFSFFTQSKTILDAFRIGTASSGGSFSLTLYGSSVPIVSSTTASGIGLDSGTIDFFKSIMTVGLWLMLAWYLYWRIASIFGV